MMRSQPTLIRRFREPDKGRVDEVAIEQVAADVGRKRGWSKIAESTGERRQRSRNGVRCGRGKQWRVLGTVAS